MRVSKRQLRRIIREQISATPTGRVEVEWDFFSDMGLSPTGDRTADEDAWNDMSYEEQEAEAGLPPVIEIPSDVMNQYTGMVRKYGEAQAEDMITDWLSEENGWPHQGWSWV
jgi:hypothetical protein